MPVADGRAVGQGSAGVEPDLLEPVVGRRYGGDARLVLDRVEHRGLHVVGEVDLALAQCLGHGVGVLVDPEGQLLDRRLGAEVVGIGLEADELALAALDQHVRARADDRVALGRLVGVRADLLAVDLAPDVLGKDVDRQAQHDRRGLGHGEHQRGVVGGLGLGDVRGVAAVVVLLVLASEDPVEGVGGVTGGQRLPVAPLQARADPVGPGRAVGRLLPGLREVGHRREVLRRARGEARVHQLVHLVRGRDDAGERVHRVDVVGDPDRERHRRWRRDGRGRGRCRLVGGDGGGRCEQGCGGGQHGGGARGDASMVHGIPLRAACGAAPGVADPGTTPGGPDRVRCSEG